MVPAIIHKCISLDSFQVMSFRNYFYFSSFGSRAMIVCFVLFLSRVPCSNSHLLTLKECNHFVSGTEEIGFSRRILKVNYSSILKTFTQTYTTVDLLLNSLGNIQGKNNLVKKPKNTLLQIFFLFKILECNKQLKWVHIINVHCHKL
jgi:hypothetical protein